MTLYSSSQDDTMRRVCPPLLPPSQKGPPYHIMLMSFADHLA